MNTRYEDELQDAVKRAELLAEQIALLQRVRQIEMELSGAPMPNALVRPAKKVKVLAEGEQPKRRGRPAKVVTPMAGELFPQQPKRRGRPPKAENMVLNGEKRIELPALLETIAQQSNKPLLLTDFVAKAREAGYTTHAKDFSNMVYQALLKLVNKGMFRKITETREYEYVGKAA